MYSFHLFSALAARGGIVDSHIKETPPLSGFEEGISPQFPKMAYNFFCMQLSSDLVIVYSTSISHSVCSAVSMGSCILPLFRFLWPLQLL